MADHAKVDVALLGETASALDALHGELAAAGRTADDGGSAVGAAALRDVLHDFAHDWEVHRRSLLASLEAVAAMARSGHDTYVEIEQQLTAALVGGR